MDEPRDAEADPTASRTDFEALADQLDRAQFTVAFRGFEPTEVQDLLRSVATRLRAAPDDGRPDDQGPAGAGSADGGAATMRIRRAELEASELIRRTRAEAAQILEDAENEARTLRTEAVGLRDEARASMLTAIREANALVERGRREAGRRP